MSIYDTLLQGNSVPKSKYGATVVRTVDAQEEPVSLVELRAHLKIPTVETESADLLAKIKAARNRVEKHTGKPIIQQIFVQRQNMTPAKIYLFRKPLIAVTGISTITNLESDTEIPADSAGYFVNTAEASVRTRTVWPTHRADQSFAITFKAGYVPLTWAEDADAAAIAAAKAAAQAAVPSDLKLAVMNLIGHYYENREGQSAERGSTQQNANQIIATAQLPESVADLLEQYKDYAA